MSEEGYNGWTNYETWAVNIWMDNDQGSQEYWREIAQDLVKSILEDAEEGALLPTEQAAYALGEVIKEQHEDMLEEMNFPQAGPFTDLLNGALSEVNWYEIAQHLVVNCIGES